MKIKLFLVVILISLTTIAQTDTKTYHDQMKVLMSQLDSTRFKNNTLYDRVYPLLVSIGGKQVISKDCFVPRNDRFQIDMVFR